MKMIGVYSRTATKDEEAIKLQKEKCLMLIEKGRKVIFFTDNGVSGLENDRDGIAAMFEVARHNALERVIAVEPSRFSRDTNELSRIESDLRKYGVIIQYADTSTSDTVLLH
ncbi:recombinase family protein [Brevibacillus gelatini]|uniref:Recombinase family protein n=1 Tax=Brevibacillus gelatini TaxID=1655277 RepID=A0A3M8B7X5_9BACL|nr:recombinase family protein [Brevibacillus gelatini]RNB59479.1 recombinase family protein [Brevibacillus gelatini]